MKNAGANHCYKPFALIIEDFDENGNVLSSVPLTFFGQVVSAEILMASDHGCPIEMHQIKIDKCDEMYDDKCKGDTTMPFTRARYDPSTGQSPNNPREQTNRIEL